MRVYIAGAYTPRDGREETRLENIRIASEAGQLVLRAGHVPFCPHTMTAGWEASCSYDDFMRMGLEWLRQCDAILLLPGWRLSNGARIEAEEAMRLRMVMWDASNDSHWAWRLDEAAGGEQHSCR